MARLDERTWRMLWHLGSPKTSLKERKDMISSYVSQAKYSEDPNAKRLLQELQKEPSGEVPPHLKGILRTADDLLSRITVLTEDQEELVDTARTIYRNSVELGRKGMVFPMTIMLLGKPGTGKTLFAQELARRMQLPFYYVSMASLVDSLLGKTGQNVQEVLRFTASQPCILMLDEIDAIAMSRSSSAQHHSEDTRTLIAVMQGLDQIGNGNIIMAATNRYDLLDEAVKRRFRVNWSFHDHTPVEAERLIGRYLEAVGIEPEEKVDAAAIEEIVGDAVNPARLIDELNQEILMKWPGKPDIKNALQSTCIKEAR